MLKTQTLQQSSDMAENPAFSPDAREIAFAWFDGGRYQLRIVENRIGAKARVLIDSLEFSYFYPSGWSRDRSAILATTWKADNTTQLDWVNLKDGSFRTLKSLEWRQPGRVSLSSDGKYIAYSARGLSDTAHQRYVYLIASDGSAEAALVGGAGVNDDPIWTPDGRHVLFTSDRSGSLALWSVAVRDGKPAGDPFLVKPDMGTKTYLVGLTRNGSYYYMTRRGGTDVFVAEAGRETLHITGTPKRLSEKFVGSNRSPAWSPDGKSIAFKRSGSWAFDIVVRSVETGQERSYPVPSRTRPNPQLHWFPDSKAILIDVADSQARFGYYRLDLDNGKFAEVVPPTSGFTQWAVLSRDGRTVLIPKNGGQGKAQIIAFDIATRSEKVLATHQALGTRLSASPNGRTLAMTRTILRGQQQETVLASIETDGSNYRILPTGDAIVSNNGPLAWSSDGRFVIFGSANNRVMRVSPEGGTAEFTGLTVRPQHAVDFNPDGSRIVFGDGPAAVKEIWVLENTLAALPADRR